MAGTTTSTGQPIKVGVIADQTGALSFVGVANANVARMVVADINAKGGLLGRQVELVLEDSATDDSVAAAKAAKLVKEDRVDVILGGIYSSTRQAIKGPAVIEGRTLYIYPEQYEGQEYDPLLFCTGPVPAQQLEFFIPWLMQQTRGKKFYLPSADYIWPHTMNQRLRPIVAANGGTIVGEEYFPLDHSDYARTVEQIMASGTDVVFCTVVPPGVGPFLEQLHNAGFSARGGQIVCTYFDENFLNMVPAAHVEGLWSCLDYYQAVPDQHEAARAVQRALSRSRQVHRWQRVFRTVPGAAAVGGRGARGRLAGSGHGRQGPGPRQDCRRAGRAGRDGAW
jgi:branched-chain amino acid transport system substrate-binding protein